MNFSNAVFPGPAQTAAFFGGAKDGPFVMINLLKFRERAEYASRATMMAMVSSPEYQAIAKHRIAGQLNIRTKALGG